MQPILISIMTKPKHLIFIVFEVFHKQKVKNWTVIFREFLGFKVDKIIFHEMETILI